MRAHILTVIWSVILSALVAGLAAVAQLGTSGHPDPAVLITVWVSAFAGKLLLGTLNLYERSPADQAANARLADNIQMMLNQMVGPIISSLLAPKPPIHVVPMPPAQPAPKPAQSAGPAPTVAVAVTEPPAVSTDTPTHP